MPPITPEQAQRIRAQRERDNARLLVEKQRRRAAGLATLEYEDGPDVLLLKNALATGRVQVIEPLPQPDRPSPIPRQEPSDDQGMTPEGVRVIWPYGHTQRSLEALRAEIEKQAAHDAHDATERRKAREAEQPREGRRYPDDLTGLVFGRLTVLERFEPGKPGPTHWRVRCSCPEATEKIVRRGNLVGTRTQSCGCLSREIRATGRTSAELERADDFPVTVRLAVPGRPYELRPWTAEERRAVEFGIRARRNSRQIAELLPDRSRGAVNAEIVLGGGRANYRAAKRPTRTTRLGSSSNDHYHLSLEDRQQLARWLRAGTPSREIARRLGRAESTILRELHRNGGRESYDPEAAQNRTSRAGRVSRPGHRYFSLGEFELIRDGLREGMTHTEIARRLGRRQSTISRLVAEHGGRQNFTIPTAVLAEAESA